MTFLTNMAIEKWQLRKYNEFISERHSKRLVDEGVVSAKEGCF